MYNRTQQGPSPGANNSFLNTNSGSSTDGISLEWQANSKLTMWIYNLNNNWNDIVTGTTPVGAWYHLAIVRKDTAFTMYIDGVPQTATGNTSSSSFTSASCVKTSST